MLDSNNIVALSTRAMCTLFALWLVADTLFLADHAWQIEQRGRVGLVAHEGKIAFVGSEALARKMAITEVKDFGHATILPGLNDAHVHLAALGRRSHLVDLDGAASAEAAAARVAAFLRAHPEATLVEGQGWDQNRWPKARMPSTGPLDAVSKTIPIVLRRVDGHALWCNRAALSLASLEKDPPGGRVLRQKGAPSGVLLDAAMALVEQKLPKRSAREVEEDLLEGQRLALAAGLTAVGDMGIDPLTLEAYRALASSGRLRVRVHGAITAEVKEALPEPEKNHFSARAVKIYADGALGSRGARLLAPYHDEPGQRGLFLTQPADLKTLVARAAEAGFQPCVHAIGDAAVRAALDAFAALSVQARVKLRPRVEHAQVIAPSDLDRFAALSVIASMQPVHFTSDSAWAESRIGSERMKGAYAWRSLQERGVVLAFGSDAPVEQPNPFAALQAAVRRREPLTLAQAVDGFTRGAAFAAFRENELGSLTIGKLADLTVIDGTLEQAIEEPGSVRTQVVIDGELLH